MNAKSFGLQIYFQKALLPKLKHERLLLLFVVCALLILAPDGLMAQRGTKIRTVVIDAGHGGKDPGAIGKRSKEKNITLAVALQTGNYIKANLPDVKVIFTRTTDEFIELHRRAAIANENDADVFISIHCNASKNTTVSGAESYVMGEHRSKANLEVAKLENAAILLEENADDEYGGFDPNSTAGYIAFTLYQSESKHQSLQLAQNLQEQFTKRVGRKDRSVQQAGFLVLYRTTMPSVLVELGFITNPAEETFLLSDEGQAYMASAIYRAFRDFKKDYERENTLPIQLSYEEKAILTPDVLKAEEAERREEKPAPKPRATLNQDVVFKVQFATNTKKIPLNDARFKNIEQPDVYEHNGMFKYTSGSFASKDEAIRHQQTMQKKGYSDAFVVAFVQGKRSSIEEAEKQLLP